MASIQDDERDVQDGFAKNMSSMDLELDPADPLSLLLQSTTDSSSSSSSQVSSPPDWSQFSTLWPTPGENPDSQFASNNVNTKLPEFGMNLGLPYAMDFDFLDPMSMSINPDALQFDDKMFAQPAFDMSFPSQELFPPALPFTFSSSPSASSTSETSESADENSVRLSVSSQFSSSSPAQDLSVSARPAQPQQSSNHYRASQPAAQNVGKDLVEALAQRARQIAGVTLAVPAGSLSASTVQAKLPIPRLARPSKVINAQLPKRIKSQPDSSSSSASSPSPDPSSPPHSSSESASFATIDLTVPHTASSTSVLARPKTSHTTIERRYRTNLNARIQSLRQTVPALRVLEQNYAGAEEDVVDERGYIDGVKVARKGSKANVLGKAVEYIKVLKKREARLKREQAGLRSLIGGLVGGPALLREWEQEWVEKFGGPEKDEIDPDAAADEPSDDEEGDGEGGDEGEEEGRARKKFKIGNTSAPKKEKRTPPAISANVTASMLSVTDVIIAAAAGGVVPEKRKRGRPRKVQPTALPQAPHPVPMAFMGNTAQGQQDMMQVQVAAQSSAPQQYLLAVFAIFSFLNSPLTSSRPHTPTHQGTVISHVSLGESSNLTPSSSAGWGWSDLIQGVHLLASLVVLASIIIPRLHIPRLFKPAQIVRLFPFISSLINHGQSAGPAPLRLTGMNNSAVEEDLTPPSPSLSLISDSTSDESSSSEDNTTSTADAYESSQTRSPLASALIPRGTEDEKKQLLAALNLDSGILHVVRSALKTTHTVAGSDRPLERQAWLRLGELIVLGRPNETSWPVRWRVYSQLSSMFKPLGDSALQVSDLCTMALLAHHLPSPLSRGQAEAMWARAKNQAAPLRCHERIVMEMDIKDAALRLSNGVKETVLSPLSAIAVGLIRERLRAYAAQLFVQSAVQGVTNVVQLDGIEWRETLTSARALGGRVGELADVLEKLWGSGAVDFDDILPDHIEGDAKVELDEEIAFLLSATALCRQVLPLNSHVTRVAQSEVQSSANTDSTSPPTRVEVGHDQDLILRLRQVLGSSAFDDKSELAEEGNEERTSLEDARDHVVDLLVEYERKRRGRR